MEKKDHIGLRSSSSEPHPGQRELQSGFSAFLEPERFLHARLREADLEELFFELTEKLGTIKCQRRVAVIVVGEGRDSGHYAAMLLDDPRVSYQKTDVDQKMSSEPNQPLYQPPFHGVERRLLEFIRR